MAMAVSISGEADAHRDAGLLLDLRSTDADVVPAVGLHPDLAPEVLPVIDRVRGEAVGEAVVLLGAWVEGALDRQIDRLAVLLLALLVDLPVVDDVVLVDRAGSEEPEQVMPFFAETSEAAVGLSAGMPTLSTVTSVSFFSPHCLMYSPLNHLS